MDADHGEQQQHRQQRHSAVVSCYTYHDNNFFRFLYFAVILNNKNRCVMKIIIFAGRLYHSYCTVGSQSILKLLKHQFKTDTC